MAFLKIFIASLFSLTALCPMAAASDDISSKVAFLRTFEDAESAWPAQNDGVMGGVSTGGSRIEDGVLHFTGRLSLENNGGFAQIYAPAKKRNFSGSSGIVLRVRGDGRRYQFRLATDARFRGSRIAYRASFPTRADEWGEVFLPFEAFQPTWRGRQLEGPPLDLSEVRQLAFLLADGNPGPFTLKIDWIGLQH